MPQVADKVLHQGWLAWRLFGRQTPGFCCLGGRNVYGYDPIPALSKLPSKRPNATPKLKNWHVRWLLPKPPQEQAAFVGAENPAHLVEVG